MLIYMKKEEKKNKWGENKYNTGITVNNCKGSDVSVQVY